jgi:hypothetical protein
MKRARAPLACVGLVVATLLAREAFGLPVVGAARPSVRLLDGWERTLELSRLGAKPVLVVYEDKGSSTQNQPFKDELAQLAKGDRYKSGVAFVAIADLQGYDYWPVRGLVKDAIRDESRKFGTVIYCDWDGSARAALALRRGVSSVVLYGKEGKVLFAYEGSLPLPKRREALALIRAAVEGDATVSASPSSPSSPSSR